LRLNADVLNSYSVEGAQILVGEEARRLSVTMVEAEGGVRWRRGRHRLVGWRFNAGDNNTVSKLGFKFFGGGGGDISNHRSFEGGLEDWR
jgi:hypothetical protein